MPTLFDIFMRLLVFGGNGMLGHKVVQILKNKFDLWATIRTEFKDCESNKILDKEKTVENVKIENTQTVKEIINDLRPQVIINAIGIIKQLPTAKNVIKTLNVNSIFPHYLSEFAGKTGSRLINISTDCVFSGKKGSYVETDVADAEDLYGKSKYLGEVTAENCLTIRTSIIGREMGTAHSLIEWFLSNEGKSVEGFTNAIYSGFPTIILAEILGNIIENYPKLEGLFHISSNPINKYELLQLVKNSYRAKIDIQPFDEFVIDRSLDSTLFRNATGFESPDWQLMIEKMAADNAVYEK